MGLTSTLGIAYTYFLALISLGVVTLLYILMSIPVDWVYDITMNTWLLANPAIFSEARIESYNWMMSIWALIPVMILILGPIPVYFFIKWIFGGFKKDKK